MILLENGFSSCTTQWSQLTFAIIGLGLIGGSYAKALRGLQVKQIIAVDRNKDVLEAALAENVIDIGLTEADATLAQADVVICCIYPEAIAGYIRDNLHFLKKNVLITDVAGIKGTMISDIQSVLQPGMEFISGHPMAGRQACGYAMSDAAIFQGANYIVVPETKNTEAAITWLEQFAMALGCRQTVRVTPHEHDSIIAYVSNLPHVTAVALMDSASFNEKIKYFVAGSFRDGTRVADINPELWSALFLANKDKVALEIERYMEQLQLWHDALLAGDGEQLKELMRTSAARRKELY